MTSPASRELAQDGDHRRDTEAQDALKAYPRYSQAMFKKSLANLFLAHCWGHAETLPRA